MSANATETKSETTGSMTPDTKTTFEVPFIVGKQTEISFGFNDSTKNPHGWLTLREDGSIDGCIFTSHVVMISVHPSDKP